MFYSFCIARSEQEHAKAERLLRAGERRAMSPGFPKGAEAALWHTILR